MSSCETLARIDDVTELTVALRGQGAAFGLLSRLFAKEADDELLTSLCAAAYPASTGNARLDRGYRELCHYLGGYWERTRGELAVDYFRTFIGNTQDVGQVAFPYESVCTSPERLLMQDARDGVLAAYRAVRVVIADNQTNDPEDHVAFELAFLGLLGNRAADALESGDEGAAHGLLQAKQSFMRDHLLNWVPRFADDVVRISQTGFYRGLADVLVGTLETDAAMLDELLGA